MPEQNPGRDMCIFRKVTTIYSRAFSIQLCERDLILSVTVEEGSVSSHPWNWFRSFLLWAQTHPGSDHLLRLLLRFRAPFGNPRHVFPPYFLSFNFVIGVIVSIVKVKRTVGYWYRDFALTRLVGSGRSRKSDDVAATFDHLKSPIWNQPV